MSDQIWARDEVQSPCVKLCVVHPVAGICVGCYRSIEEIGAWSSLSQDARLDVLAQLPSRAKTLTQRRGGRIKEKKKNS